MFDYLGQKIHTESTSSGGSTSSSKSRYRVKSVGNDNKLKTKPINLVITPSPDGETDSDYSKSRSCMYYCQIIVTFHWINSTSRNVDAKVQVHFVPELWLQKMFWEVYTFIFSVSDAQITSNCQEISKKAMWVFLNVLSCNHIMSILSIF